MRQVRILIPAMISIAVCEFAVMSILPTLGISDGPFVYVVDAVILVVLCSPFLSAWGIRIASPLPDRTAREPHAIQVLPLEELERQALIKALEITQGDRTRAALMLGVSRATIYRKVKMLGLGKCVKA